MRPKSKGVTRDLGMTVRLRIHAMVAPGEAYRVRIAVADVDDANFDSALFIKEGSVRTISPQP
jgi:hypothetical protein